MKALIDTCVIMDAIQKRKPFDKDAETIFLAASGQAFDGFVSAKSMTDIFYLSHRLSHNNGLSHTILGRIASIFGILDTDAEDIMYAIASDTSDFEDAVMIGTAVRERMDCIVTRNPHDYKSSPVQIRTPSEFVKALSEQRSINK